MSRAREVAEASIVLANELPSRSARPTHTNVLVEIAKRLQRLQTRASRQRRELAITMNNIKLARRELRALASEIGKGKA